MREGNVFSISVCPQWGGGRALGKVRYSAVWYSIRYSGGAVGNTCLVPSPVGGGVLPVWCQVWWGWGYLSGAKSRGGQGYCPVPSLGDGGYPDIQGYTPSSMTSTQPLFNSRFVNRMPCFWFISGATPFNNWTIDRPPP